MTKKLWEHKIGFYGWFALFALLLTVISVFVSRHFQQQLMESYERNERLVQLSDSLLDRFENMRPVHPSIPRMNQYEYNSLRGKGLSAPGEQLVKDLSGNEELIPFEGTHGGTMGFYAPENIFIMNDQWAFAYFEDGHRAGNLLLRFDVTDEGKIEWTVLDAYLQ